MKIFDEMTGNQKYRSRIARNAIGCMIDEEMAADMMHTTLQNHADELMPYGVTAMNAEALAEAVGRMMASLQAVCELNRLPDPNVQAEKAYHKQIVALLVDAEKERSNELHG